MVTSRWVLLGSLGATCVLAAPAHAGSKLVSWSFDPLQNRLSLQTEVGVQPRAQLIPDPDRIVLDLPGTAIGNTRRIQNFNGAVRQVRVGQFNAQTTRVVIELAPGYAVDPHQVRVRGATARQWSVQLPAPQYAGAPATARPAITAAQPPQPTLPASSPTSQSQNSSGSGTFAAAAPSVGGPLRVTRGGILLRLPGGQAVGDVSVSYSADRKHVDVLLPDVAWPDAWAARPQDVGKYGIGRAEFLRASGQQPTRLRLQVNPESPNWRAIAARSGDLVLVPRGGVSAVASLSSPAGASTTVARIPEPVAPPPRPVPPRRSQAELRRLQELSARNARRASSSPSRTSVATIDRVLVLADNRVVVRGNRALHPSAPIWDPRSGSYTILVRNATLSPTVRGPQLPKNGPVRQVRLLQRDANTVAISVAVANGVRAGQIARLDNGRVAALDLHAPVAGRPWGISPANAQSAPTTPAVPRSNVPKSATLVAVDPGHGGKDPGAIGIGGLREKDVVIDISRHLQRMLSERGMRVIMTRSDDRFVSLQGRTVIANRANADLFVSVHANAISLSRPDVNGVETFYYSGSGRPLASSIQRSVLQKFGMRDRGVKRAGFYVLKHSDMPAVLVEVGFVTGREDAPKLRDPAFRRQMAEAIADGVLNHVRRSGR